MNDENNGSFFKKALIASPFLVGAGYTINNFRNNPSVLNEPILKAPPAASAAIRDFASQYFNSDPSFFRMHNTKELSILTREILNNGNIPLSGEDVKESIFRIAKRMDPSDTAREMLNKRLKGLETADDIMRTMTNISSSSDSVYMQRIIGKLNEDLKWKMGRLEKGLPISTQAFNIDPVKDNIRVGFNYISGEAGTLLQEMEDRSGLKIATFMETRGDIPESLRGYNLKFFPKGTSDNLIDANKIRPMFTTRIAGGTSKNPNIVTRGASNQSKYIAGTYDLIENGILKKSFNHEEWVMFRMNNEIVPQMLDKANDPRKIQSILKQFESTVTEDLEWIPSLYQKEHQGLEEYIKHRQNISRVYVQESTGKIRRMNDLEQYKIMEQGGLKTAEGKVKPVFPAFSPSQVAKGVVGTQDVRGGMFLVPESVPYGRRPAQYLRSGSAPLNPDKLAAHGLTQEFNWAKAKMGIDTPMARAVYVSGQHNFALQGTGFSAEGQTIINDELADLLSNKRIHQELVDWNNVSEEAKNLMGSDSYKSFKYVGGGNTSTFLPIEAGTFLGRDLEGNPIEIGKNRKLVSAVVEEDKSRGKYLRFMFEEEVNNIQTAKVFGGTKGMVKRETQEYMDTILRNRVGIQERSLPYNINTIITMDELKKNRGLHYNQMFTSLWDYTDKNMKSGMTNSVLASNFASNPNAMIEKFRRQATQGDKFSHEFMLKRIKLLARSAKLTPEQMGHVFGAVPEVFEGGISALGKLSERETAEISKGIATGVTQLWYESATGPGSGKMATIEPRMFELLSSPHYGALGPQLQEDISKRMIAAYPERLAEQKDLMKAFSSVVDPQAVEGSVAPSQIKSLENPLNIQLKGIGDIYYPGESKLKQLAGYKQLTESEKTMFSPLAETYKDVIGAAGEYEAGKITEAEMRGRLRGLSEKLQSSVVGTVTGEGGLLRNRLPGSQFFTGMMPTATHNLPENVAGITASNAKRMFEGMRGLGLYDPEAINQMEHRFMMGDRIGGVVSRHPYIGQFSSMPMQFQMVEGDKDIILMNEKLSRATAIRGQVVEQDMETIRNLSKKAISGDQEAIKALQQKNVEVLNPLRMSPYVGMAGDVDGDIFSAMFAGPQLQDSLKSHMMTPEAIDDYQTHMIRMQSMKGKGLAGDITMRQAMAGDVIKLGVTGKVRPGEGPQRVGKLSSELQQYRASILSGAKNLTENQSRDALSLLEWLEQTPISAKHIKGGQELETISLLDNLQSSLKRKKSLDIQDITDEVLQYSKMTGRASIGEGFTTFIENPETGEMTSKFIPGIDIENTAKNITAARTEFEQTQLGRQSSANIRKMIMDRGGISNGREALDVLQDLSQTQKSVFGQFFPGAERKVMSESVEKGLSTMNKLMAAGKSAIPLAKPLMLGGAAALGLAAVLSDPPKMIAPEANVAPVANLKSGTGGANLGYGEHPEPTQHGQPTAPDLSSYGSSARIVPRYDNYSIRVSGNTGTDMNVRNINRQIRSSLRGSSRTSSTIRDNRSKMTPQRLSSIINDD